VTVRQLGRTGAFLCAALAVVSCGALPGTSRCTVGGVERTIQCADICKEASEARSNTERDDIRACAEQDCDKQCE